MHFNFKIGDRVEFVVGKDIPAMVTAYFVRSEDHVQYEVSWFHEGSKVTNYFDASEIRYPVSKSGGFIGNQE